MNIKYKPYFLPQISAPYTEVLKKIDEYNEESKNDNFKLYKKVKINPEELSALQPIVFSSGIKNIETNDENPIWVDVNNNVLDGHHRWIKCLIEKKPITAIKLNLDWKNACRILNKIQDIFDYERCLKLEETVQNAHNVFNTKDADVSYSEFLAMLETENKNITQHNKNKTKVIGYRKDPIKTNSQIGNFFVITPQDNLLKYEIEFENLLDTNHLGVAFFDGQEPIDVLCKTWFPHINYDEISKKFDIDQSILKAKSIIEKAKSLGYDGIKYGDKIIQAFK